MIEFTQRQRLDLDHARGGKTHLPRGSLQYQRHKNPVQQLS